MNSSSKKKNNLLELPLLEADKDRILKKEKYKSTKSLRHYLVFGGVVFGDAFIASIAMAVSYYNYLSFPVFSSFKDFSISLPPFTVFVIQYPTEIHPQFLPYLSVLYFVPFIRLGFYKHFGLYNIRGSYSILEDFANIFKSVIMGSLVISATAFMYRGGLEFRAYSYARTVFIFDFFFCLSGMILWRLLFRIFQGRMRMMGYNLIPILVVGTGDTAKYIAKAVNKVKKYGYQIIGIIKDNPEFSANELENKRILGTIENIPPILEEKIIEEVFFTNNNFSHKDLFELMLRCPRKAKTKFKVVPDLLNFVPGKLTMNQVGNIPLIELFEDPLRGYNKLIKRSLDLLLIFLTLPVLLPVFMIILIAIRLDSKGPFFFKQVRVGRDGRIFLFYKFRSMQHNNDDTVHKEYLKKLIVSAEDNNLGDSKKPVYKLKGDSRITRVGNFLRKYSLDELPQLLNVVKGEMSLVGPRPPIEYEVEHYKDWHRKRLDVTPGCTGLWQISGRNRLNFDQMVELDIYYIENWSLWMDIKILLQTIPVILKGSDAY